MAVISQTFFFIFSARALFLQSLIFQDVAMSAVVEMGPMNGAAIGTVDVAARGSSRRQSAVHFYGIL